MILFKKKKPRGRSPSPPTLVDPNRPLPGTLVKANDLPMLFSTDHLLKAKERLVKQLKAMDEEDERMLEEERRIIQEQKEERKARRNKTNAKTETTVN